MKSILPPSKKNITLEDLLRIKRAERPTPEFWAEFERQLREKQLAAIITPPRWWETLSLGRFVTLISQQRAALSGVAAVSIVLFMVSRELSLDSTQPPIDVYKQTSVATPGAPTAPLAMNPLSAAASLPAEVSAGRVADMPALNEAARFPSEPSGAVSAPGSVVVGKTIAAQTASTETPWPSRDDAGQVLSVAATAGETAASSASWTRPAGSWAGSEAALVAAVSPLVQIAAGTQDIAAELAGKFGSPIELASRAASSVTLAATTTNKPERRVTAVTRSTNTGVAESGRRENRRYRILASLLVADASAKPEGSLAPVDHATMLDALNEDQLSNAGNRAVGLGGDRLTLKF